MDHLRMEVKKHDGFMNFMDCRSGSGFSIFCSMLTHSLYYYSWSGATI